MTSTLQPPIRTALAEALPGVAADRAEVIGEGWGSVAYRLPEANGDWVLRLPRKRSPWAVEDLEREVRLLPLLEQQPFEIAVPREARLLCGADGATLGALHRMVPGTPLIEAARPRGRARATLLAGIGRALSVLHATPRDEARRHGAREMDLWSEHYVAQIERALPLLPPASRAWLEAKAEAFEQSGGTAVAGRVLVHADLSADHFLVDGAGRLSGMIDFADARLADPALDFAGLLRAFTARNLEVVLAHYSGDVDAGLLDRARFYDEISPLYQVTDGAVAVGPHEARRGVRRLAARAGAAARERSAPARRSAHTRPR